MSFAAAVLAAALATLVLSSPAGAQTPGAPRLTAVRAVLATTRLPSVVEAPLHYKLLRVSIPAGQSILASSAPGFLHQLSGALGVASDGDRTVLREGDAMLVTGGKGATLTATGAEPAVFLRYLLLRAAELDGPVATAPAVVTELYRTPAPLPGLQAGPYEFSLTRVTFPPRLPANPPHRRSGAALYYVLSGSGAITFGGKTEPRPAGSIQYEPHDFVHQWANPADSPLVLLQANISQEGVPVVIFDSAATPTAPR